MKPDYAKWMLDEPRVNFAISTRGGRVGLDHLGIQVETADELQEVYRRLRAADQPVLEEGMTTCCYAQSEKSWIADPAGIAWEAFHTTGESAFYGHAAAKPDGVRIASAPRAEVCCGDQQREAPAAASCCTT